jgi:uncharacterized membrane protein
VPVAEKEGKMASSDAGSTSSAGSGGERDFGARARDAAHRPGTKLAGPYGHPIHPMIVPVAIGAWVCAVAFDIASLAVEGQAYARPAKWLVAIGVVAAIVAAVFGLMDYRRLVKGTKAHKVATTHLLVNDVVLVLFIISFFVRHADDTDLVDGTPILAFVLALVGLVGLAVGGYLGGELAYRYGVRGTDDADQLAAYVPASMSARPSEPVTADDASD